MVEGACRGCRHHHELDHHDLHLHDEPYRYWRDHVYQEEDDMLTVAKGLAVELSYKNPLGSYAEGSSDEGDEEEEEEGPPPPRDNTAARRAQGRQQPPPTNNADTDVMHGLSRSFTPSVF